MKNIHYKIVLLLLLFVVAGARGQTAEKGKGKAGIYVEYTPLDQAVETESGVEVQAYVDISCFGSGTDYGDYFILPQVVDGGYINVSPPNGFLAPGESVLLTFRFEQTVSTTTSFLYEFLAQWFDENGELSTEILTIDVTYLEAVPACTLAYPSNRSTSNITTTSATIGWSSVSGSAGYESQVKPASGGSWTNVGTNSNTSQNITGLTPDTAYKWRVRTECSTGDYGDWSPEKNFSTQAECNLNGPNGLFVTELTDISARLNWSPVSGSTAYQIRIRQLPSGAFSTAASGITGTSRVVSGLLPETGYEWQVRARCANGSYSSNWSGGHQFVTEPECPENRNITQNVTSGSDIDDSELTLQASNIIFSGANAEYDTGDVLTLLPGFHARAGSTFRAYMEGCEGFLAPEIPNENEVVERTPNGTKELKSLKLFPNPTRDRFIIESEDEMVEWSINNHFGSLQQGNKLSTGNATKAVVNISNYPTGVYFVTAVFKDGEIVQKMLVKK